MVNVIGVCSSERFLINGPPANTEVRTTKIVFKPNKLLENVSGFEIAASPGVDTTPPAQQWPKSVSFDNAPLSDV